MRDVSRWLIRAIGAALLLYGVYVAMILFGIHIVIVKNVSGQAVVVSPSIANQSLPAAALNPGAWTVRWASVRNGEGDIRIGCLETQSGQKNEYGVDYVTFNEFIVYMVEIDGCSGVERFKRVAFGPIRIHVFEERPARPPRG